MEGKRVDVGKSFLDTYNHTLSLVFTSAGSLEHLLGEFMEQLTRENSLFTFNDCCCADQEVEGGTEVRGWLEGHRGRWVGDL